MIALPRSLARRCQGVLRRCFASAVTGVLPQIVLKHTGQALVLEAVTEDVAVRLEVPGLGAETVLAFRGEELARFAGKSDDLVALALSSPGQTQAAWSVATPRWTLCPP